MHMHMRTHTHTPLCGYGLSTGPTDGLSSWWLRNRSPPTANNNNNNRGRVVMEGENSTRDKVTKRRGKEGVEQGRRQGPSAKERLLYLDICVRASRVHSYATADGTGLSA